MGIWFNVQIPQIALIGTPTMFLDATVRWTRYLMHNLFEKVSITFNELEVEVFDNFYLDFYYQFRTRGSKRIGYRQIVGDIASMTTPVGVGIPLGTGTYFSCPFPFWFTEDSGIALPAAALPFNDIKVNYIFRRFEDLIVVSPGVISPPQVVGTPATVNNVKIFGQPTQQPKFLNPNTYAHYAVVHNDERVKMGDAPRDILISQVQTAPYAPFKDLSSPSCFDLRFSHAVVSMFFAAQNYSIAAFGNGVYGAEWSNYTTEPNYTGLDPLDYSQLVYENTTRLAMHSDYYSLIQPWYTSKAIPVENGYHMWSYSLHPWWATSPAGSTNYSKLSNVSIVHNPSPAAQAAAGINTPGNIPLDKNGQPITFPLNTPIESGSQYLPLKLRHILTVRNHNIVRIANGSLGQPTL